MFLISRQPQFRQKHRIKVRVLTIFDSNTYLREKIVQKSNNTSWLRYSDTHYALGTSRINERVFLVRSSTSDPSKYSNTR